MSRSLNKVMLIGNVGKEPELNFTPGGIPVASFCLATSETWKDRDGKEKEHTDWHNIVAWRRLAEVVQMIVHKGARIYIEGKIQTRTFDDKYGTKKHIVEIHADQLLMLDSKRGRDDDTEVDYDQQMTSEKAFDYTFDFETKYD